ncbi:MAG: hypothetical protein DRJ31_03810 [Candidatus Methanomethylicota archaeon]|uniref:Nmd3 N-terminal domain-containing protein n=1 Tax=Thermoproteota archaeon TaxID=2056631 RepID=A0A497EQT4_9CREN|nr:MAG: hypothetical protein DRJ31_03810 [Candidatus Verstraetearchaeota archaeon]
MVRFCAICGRREDEVGTLIENLCSDCYRELKLSFPIPRELRIEECEECGAVKKGGVWEKGENVILKVVEDTLRKSLKIPRNVSLKVEPTLNEDELTVKLMVSAEGRTVVNEKVIKLRKVKRLCQRCARIARGQYSAIVQVRGKEGELSAKEREVLSEAFEIFNKKFSVDRRGTQVVDVEDVRGGVDVKFLSHQAAKFFASILKDRFGVLTKESYKLIGVDRSSGKRTFRLTISARMPKYKKGDIVEIGSEHVYVIDVAKDVIKGVRLSDQREISLRVNDLEKQAAKVRVCKLRKARVISLRDQVIAELLDESRGKVIEIPLRQIPLDVKEGDEVDILEVEGKTYVVTGLIKP